MKTFKKNHFCYFNVDGSDKEAGEGDVYFQWEWRFTYIFPFYRRFFVTYQLENDMWVEKDCEL